MCDKTEKCDQQKRTNWRNVGKDKKKGMEEKEDKSGACAPLVYVRRRAESHGLGPSCVWTGKGAERVSRGAWLLRLLTWLNRKKRLCAKLEK